MKNLKRVLGCAAVPALLLAATVWFINVITANATLCSNFSALLQANPAAASLILGFLAYPIVNIVLVSLGFATVLAIGIILLVIAHKNNDNGLKLRLGAIAMTALVSVIWLNDLLTLILAADAAKKAGMQLNGVSSTIISVLVLLLVVIAGYIAAIALGKKHRGTAMGAAAGMFGFVLILLIIFNRINNNADDTVTAFVMLLAILIQAGYFLLPKEEKGEECECECKCEAKEEKKERPHAKLEDVPVEEEPVKEEPAEVLPEPEEEVEEHEPIVEVPAMEEKEEDMEVGPVQEGSPEAHAEERKRLETLKQAGLISEEECNKKLEKLQ